MVSLSECAPCRAKRLKEESEREFKKRFGMIDLNRLPLRMGWKPYMGQMQPETIAPAALPTSGSPVVPRTYLENLQERLLWFGGGALFGLPVGLVGNLAFKSLRRPRDEAWNYALIMSAIGLAAAILPFERNDIQNVVTRVAGLFAGSGLSDVILPRGKAAVA